MVAIVLVLPCAKWRGGPYRGSPADITEAGEGKVLLVWVVQGSPGNCHLRDGVEERGRDEEGWTK